MFLVLFSSTLLLLQWVLGCSGQTFLLATDSAVKVFSADTTTTTTVISQGAITVDFRHNRGDIFLISDKNILYSYYSHFEKEYADPIPVVVSRAGLRDLVVDWVSYRIFYSSQDEGVVHHSPLLGNTTTRISPPLVNVKDLAIDPYHGLLFFIKNSALMSLGLESSRHTQYHFTSHGVTRVVKAAVDHHDHQVYVVGCDDSLPATWSLVQGPYHPGESSLVYQGPELANPRALDVFNDQVVWVGLRNSLYTLYSCKLSPTCDRDNITVLLQSTEPINDIRFYNPLVQTPDTDSACANLQCSHSCTVVSLYTVRCTCPEDMWIEADGVLCRDGPPHPDSHTPDELSIWYAWAEEFLLSLADAAFEWLSSMTGLIRSFVLVCCVLMLTLLLCGLCLMMAARPKHTAVQQEAYDLRERRRRR